MNKLALVIGVLAFGCGKGKQVGQEVCGVVASKAKLCHDDFWKVVTQDSYGEGYRKQYEGKEQSWCEEKFQEGLASGDVFDSCIKTDDCKAWSACVYPKGFFGGAKH